MKQILITKQDYTRIHQAINNAKQSNSIKKDEAEKLLAELHSAKIVKSEEIPADVVTMNSIVKFHFENNKKEMQFQIVYPNQADFRNGKVSIFSPVAAALIVMDPLPPEAMLKLTLAVSFPSTLATFPSALTNRKP